MKEWTNEKMWIKANPGLGTIKSLSQFRDDVERGKNDPSYYPTLMVKDFNIKQNPITTWLPYEHMVNETIVDMEYLRHSYAIGGCDLSATTEIGRAHV